MPARPKAKRAKREGFSPAQIAAASRARDHASSQTPGAVLNAFLPDRILLGDLPLQPVTMATIMCLQKLDSSLLKTETAAEFRMDDIAAALFVMSQPIDHVRRLLAATDAAGRRPHFDSAVFEMAQQIPAAALAKVGEILNAHLVSAFGTAIPHGEKVSRDPDSPFGTAPAPRRGTDGSSP